MGAQAVRIQQLWDMLDAWCCKGHEAWSENIRVAVSKKLYSQFHNLKYITLWKSNDMAQFYWSIHVDPRNFQLLESKFDMLEGFGHG